MADRSLWRGLMMATGLALSACGTTPQVDFTKQGTLREPQWCGLGNFCVVHIDPNGRAVDYRWQAFNKVHGNMVRVPFEEISLECGAEEYLITDRDVGNGSLKVNGTHYRLSGDNPTLVIRFGEGVSFAPAYPYRQASHWYNPF